MVRKSIELSIRLDLPDGSRFGPGKKKLLAAIEQTGSISSAAKELSMSYPRALRLVNEMNTQFSAPLIKKFQGGATRGGANLTDLGHEVLELYREIGASAKSSALTQLNRLQKITRS